MSTPMRLSVPESNSASASSGQGMARNTQGVIVFRTADDAHVVSVERLEATGGDDAEETGDNTGDDGGDQTSAE